ncbi:PAS domain S-box protein [Guyparkeria sp. 1SP6A2]|nr:PAS domain S-box protein [Guyparkeria sp. 1SP6A2]
MTPAWVETYFGLIYLVYGLAFFVLGVAALLSMRRGRDSWPVAHLGWLAAFGMLHGLQEFIDGERLDNPAGWLAGLSAVLMVLSFAALLEFGRRLWNERGIGVRLRALPLYAAAIAGTAALVLGGAAGTAGLELGARYLLGLPGAALAGVGLFARAGATVRVPESIAIIHWLRIAALAMLAYAALTLFLSPDSGRSLVGWLPDSADFLATTGLPVQLARAVTAVLLAMAFVILNRLGGAFTATTLHRVIDNLNGFVYRCRNDRDRTVTFLSGGTENLTGYPSEDYLHADRQLIEQVHADDRQRIREEIQAAVASCRQFRLQYRIVHRAGDVHWCYEEGRGVFGSQGDLLYLEGLVRKDDERQKAQQALHQERDFAQGLLDTAPVIILLLDPHGTIRHVNPYFEQLTGYRLDEVEGKDWFSTFLPAREQERIRELFDTAIDERPVRGNVNLIVTRSGEERAIEWHALTLRDTAGQKTGLLSVGMDVTERQRLEHQLRELNKSLEQRVADRTADLQRELHSNVSILATAIDGFFAADYSGRIRQTNPAYCAMLGYAESELLDLRIPDIEAAETQEETVAHIHKILEQGYDRFDTRQRRKDGSTIEVEVSVKAVTLGEEGMFYVFVRDIGPRKAAEASLRHARDEAEHASAAKNEFLSRMSHELRTPLNAILGFAQMMQLPGEDSLSSQQAENVKEIHRAGEHLLELVDEVLDLARIENGRLELSLEPLELEPLVEHCVTRIGPIAAARGITVTLATSTPCNVVADPPRLRQVLLNLLSNAVKYNCERGSVEIGYSLAAANRVRVQVRDTGPGLTADQQGRLFRPFERLQSAYQGIDGTGIGLALAKRLVEGMDGDIGVESVPGEGSTFWFELPLHEAPLPETLPTAAVPAEVSGCAVLYVEDNPANLRLVQKILGKRAEVRLLGAVNAEEGLVLAEREQPDLILLDINLPGMDGFEALDRLRENRITRDTPVIAVTANAMTHEIERLWEAGFDNLLIKPINVHDLFVTIDQHLVLLNRNSTHEK